MNTIVMKCLAGALFFFFIFVTGYWLSHAGKPLNTIILTIHKLISLAAVVYLFIHIRRAYVVTPPHTAAITAIVLTALFFIVTIASGGMLSMGKTMPEAVHKMHQIMPYLTMLCAGTAIYLVPG